MAQALTIYKNLVGNVSSVEAGTSGLNEGMKESNLAAEIGGDSNQTVRVMDEVEHDRPGFSLQTPKSAE